MATDIVVTTFNRLSTLKKTLQYIWERTTTPYRLTIVDDCSRDGTRKYLRKLLKAGKVYAIHLRREKVGIHHYLDDKLGLTISDPVVFTDDDILCPKLEPDWLSRELEAMENFPRIGLLALNNPYENFANRRVLKQPAGDITYIHAVGGTFAAARREVLRDCVGPSLKIYGKSPMLTLSWRVWMHPKNWKVAYLSEVYCRHNQTISTRTKRDSTSRLAKVPPLNPETLEPAERYRR